MNKNAKFKAGCVRGVIIEKQRILLVNEKHEGNWETPGGRIDDNETVLNDALKREILEETGYDSNVLELLDFNIKQFPNKDRVFHALYKCKLAKRIAEPEADTAMRWFSTSEIKKNLEENKFDDHDKRVFEMFITEKI
jgi:ADP-ribose pyrophosphatase YjhB (NUDIX family)